MESNLPNFPPVSVLGLGPMGQALAGAFLTAGHRTTVWNRTPGKANELLARGAEPASNVGEATGAGDVIVICLRDYDAVHAVLEQASAAWEDRLLINLTSGEPDQARAMATWARTHQMLYLDGAILTPTPAIGTPAAVVLYSGDETVHDAARAPMSALKGSATFLGSDSGRANAFEVALLDLFSTAVHGVVHAFALASAEDIAAKQLAPFATGIGTMLPEMIDRFAAQIDAGEYPGDRSTIDSAAAGIAHVRNTAESHKLDTGALVAMQRLIERAIADGFGHEGLARLSATLVE